MILSLQNNLGPSFGVLIKNEAVGYKGVQLVTISRPTAYGEYAPYHFADMEQEFRVLVKGLRQE